MCDEFNCHQQPQNLPDIKLSSQKRRDFIKGLISLPLASVLAFPELSHAVGSNLNTIQINTKSGVPTSAVVAYPKQANTPTVFLIHEWWGLNDQIKAMAQEFANQGYIAVAIDMYQGKVATKRDEAKAYMSGMDKDWADEAVVAWIDWLKANPKGNGKVATVGWCFGGGWSLNTSILTAVDATVIYYGRVNKSAQDLAFLNSPILGHFGTQDKSINKEMVSKFEAALTEADSTEFTHHWYEANHAFANPTGARYDSKDAALAWDRTLKFLQKHLSS